MGRLTAATVKGAKKPGRYTDGDCLYLVVAPGGSKSWVARVQREGRQRDIGLGSTNLVSLAEAREACRQVRIQVKAGLDPVAERHKSRGIPTFREAAEALIKEQSPTWRNEKHAKQWSSTLEAYAFPKLGSISIDRITGPEVREVLLEIWLEKPETAKRLRQRISAILDWAVNAGYRDAPLLLPSSGKGLPKQPGKDKHHAALAYNKLPAFMAELRKGNSISRRALEFAILTAARSGEVRGAVWPEIDLDSGIWTIPAERMKAEREHRVPLSPAAIALLRELEVGRGRTPPLVFPGLKRKPLSDMSLSKVLKIMEVPVTVHGFRSTFRDWVAEKTIYPRELAEKALAHVVKDPTEAAYQRLDMLDRRRPMMDDWADFAQGKQASQPEASP